MTAAGKGQLRRYSLARLKKYAKEYNINVNGVIEKDDFIDRLITARVCYFSKPRMIQLELHACFNRGPMDVCYRSMRSVSALSVYSPSSLSAGLETL